MPSSPANSSRAPQLTQKRGGIQQTDTRPILSVVVPVYNEGDTILENASVIRERIAAKLQEPFELIVVSDGSTTAEGALDESGLARVIHYDRNLGKGYAVKVGALAATGRWISFVDADLDLDPAAIPDFLEVARKESLDMVIGSKRHPESRVDYPRARRVSSWFYQQLVRLLFRLDVRDTQVGLKVFRREIAEEVLPLLLVKQFAFDLEMLAVANSLGFTRIREQPITLRYRFSGSGVRSAAVLLALIDTAAIFYRLRILRYYKRKRELLPAYERGQDFRPRVTVIAPATPRLEHTGAEVIAEETDTPEERASVLARAEGEVIAFVARNTAPAANWLGATIPFLANPRIAAVVCASVAPAEGSDLERAATALQESWLAGGSHYFRFTPGNLRFVKQFPGGTMVARRDYCLELPTEDLHPDRICAALAARGRFVLYTPETVVVARRPRLWRPHLEWVAAVGRARAEAVREHGLRGLSAAAVPPTALLLFLLIGWPLAFLGGRWRLAWETLWVLYIGLVLVNSLLTGLRFRSLRVGALAAVGSVAVHLAYAASFLVGLWRRR